MKPNVSLNIWQEIATYWSQCRFPPLECPWRYRLLLAEENICEALFVPRIKLEYSISMDLFEGNVWYHHDGSLQTVRYEIFEYHEGSRRARLPIVHKSHYFHNHHGICKHLHGGVHVRALVVTVALTVFRGSVLEIGKYFIGWILS